MELHEEVVVKLSTHLLQAATLRNLSFSTWFSAWFSIYPVAKTAERDFRLALVLFGQCHLSQRRRCVTDDSCGRTLSDARMRCAYFSLTNTLKILIEPSSSSSTSNEISRCAVLYPLVDPPTKSIERCRRGENVFLFSAQHFYQSIDQFVLVVLVGIYSEWIWFVRNRCERRNRVYMLYMDRKQFAAQLNLHMIWSFILRVKISRNILEKNSHKMNWIVNR